MLPYLTVDLNDAERRTGLLDDWTWLLGPEKSPLLLTVSGDAFVLDVRDETVHFLNVSAGEVFQIAQTREAFKALLDDPAFVEEYLCLHFVEHLRARGMVLKRNEIYSYRLPLSLGGEVSADNIDMVDAEVHFSIAGQIARQIADLPEGAPITKLDLNMPKKKPWWKFW
jgi:hypothetical protein